MRAVAQGMHTSDLTPEELETVVGGIAGKQQPTVKPHGTNTVQRPLSDNSDKGPPPVSGNLPMLSPVPPPQPIVAQQIVGKAS